jgi:dephospho-CoA kinase
MYLIGLTGGIAAGKSTVAECWHKLGAIHIDADQIAREVVAKGTEGLEELSKIFGSQILDGEGNLNREKLGAIIFSNATERAKLEAVVHPRVKAKTLALLDSMPSDAVVVYNVPLLVEAKVDYPFDKVVTVEAPREKQVERLVKNRSLTPEQAIARIDSQASPALRANAADVILNSNQELSLLLKDAELLWNQIKREANAKFSA